MTGEEFEDKIIVRKSPSADTRSADHLITESELSQSTSMHINDVIQAMNWFAINIVFRGARHDWTKIKYFKEFYEQFSKAQRTGDWGTGWYDDIHIQKERHHLSDRCPEDVDLFDILEQIADSVMAGLARSGGYREEIPDAHMLQTAYLNTARKLIDHTEVQEEQDQ